MSIIDFPHYNLYNIPEALRKLANDIEKGIPAAHCIVTLQLEDSTLEYRAFGENFTKAHAVGLLEYTKCAIIGLKYDT